MNDLLSSAWMIVIIPASIAIIYCLLTLAQFISDAVNTRYKQRLWKNLTHDKSPWQKWFAWRPVRTVGGELIWWDTVYRMVGNTYVDYDDMTWYYYGTIMDVLKDPV